MAAIIRPEKGDRTFGPCPDSSDGKERATMAAEVCMFRRGAVGFGFLADCALPIASPLACSTPTLSWSSTANGNLLPNKNKITMGGWMTESDDVSRRAPPLGSDYECSAE